MPLDNKKIVVAIIDAVAAVLLGFISLFMIKKYYPALQELLYPSYIPVVTLQHWSSQDAVVMGTIMSVFIFGLFIVPLWAIHKITDKVFGVKSEYK